MKLIKFKNIQIWSDGRICFNNSKKIEFFIVFDKDHKNFDLNIKKSYKTKKLFNLTSNFKKKYFK